MMRLTDALLGVRRLGLDTSPFIYFIEQNAVYLDVVREVMRLIDTQSLAASCSVITLTESPDQTLPNQRHGACKQIPSHPVRQPQPVNH